MRRLQFVRVTVDVRIERDGLQARGWLKIVRKSEKYADTLLGQHADWDIWKVVNYLSSIAKTK